MIEKDDWRWNGQEEYLSGKVLYFRTWATCRKTKAGDHDHCEFCWDKFSDYPDTLREGYTTEDHRYWICPACFCDFREVMRWELADEVSSK